jgi:hypothetical protein
VSDTPDETALSPDEVRAWWEAYRSERCTWCGGLHVRACPRVKSFRFDGAGEKVLEVTFWRDGDWDDSFVSWPEDVPDPPGEA